MFGKEEGDGEGWEDGKFEAILDIGCRGQK